MSDDDTDYATDEQEDASTTLLYLDRLRPADGTYHFYTKRGQTLNYVREPLVRGWQGVLGATMKALRAADITKRYHAEDFDAEVMLRMSDHDLATLQERASRDLKEAWSGSAHEVALELVLQSIHLARLCSEAVGYGM